MEPSSLIRQLGGIATRQQLLARGASGGDLTTAVRTGQIRRVRQGYYTVADADPAALAAVRVGGRLGGVSAARTFGLWSGFDRRTHVALAANASRLRTQLPPSTSDIRTPDSSDQEVVLHWLAQASTSTECWRPTLFETILQVANWADTETAIACIDTARRSFALSSHTISDLFAGQPAAARARALASRPGSDSGVESIVRQRLLGRGIHVEQQVRFPGVGVVDMLVPAAQLVIEIDGKAFHSSPDQVENDRRRGAVLAGTNHRLVRLSYDRVFRDWDWCEGIITSALSSFRS